MKASARTKMKARFELAVAEFAALAGHIGQHVAGQHLAGGLLQKVEGLAQRIARREIRLDRHRAELVEALELLGRHRLLHLDDVGKLHHLARGRAHEDARQRRPARRGPRP